MVKNIYQTHNLPINEVINFTKYSLQIYEIFCYSK